MSFAKGCSLAIAMAIANFLWQAAPSQDWKAAFERSYFQAAAVLIVWINYGSDQHQPVAGPQTHQVPLAPVPSTPAG
jgi:hypothetical protein